MAGQNTRFYLDKEHGKFLGVCAGIADYWGIDVTLVRIGAVVAALVTGWPVLVYFLIAFMAPRRPHELDELAPAEKEFWRKVRKNPKRSARMVRGRFREIDRRLADVETYLTSPDRRLAREIDSLR
ncbi:MAG: phage shock protein PspC [Alphaproteobacteria bacterium]|nr:phage shock protein PspC [Alphaproteobacteria bacterium]